MKVTQLMRKALPLKTCGAVIVAAGNASRMGGIDKVMAQLKGEPMILRTVRTFQNCDCISEIVIVTRPDLIQPISNLTAHMDKVKAVVAGGSSRQESVNLGLEALGKEIRLAAIHDGARPLISWEVIDRTVRAANTYNAAAPAIPVKDTIKVVEGRVVVNTPDRATLFAVQTPQVFDYDLLMEAYAIVKGQTGTADGSGIKSQSMTGITDDAMIMERSGLSRVKLVMGDYANVKVTTPEDLRLL